MNLRSSKGLFLRRTPVPSADSVVEELLAEEVRFRSVPGKRLLPSPNQTFVLPLNLKSSSQAKPRTKPVTDECSFCHQMGHEKVECPILQNKQPWKSNDRREVACATSGDGKTTHSNICGVCLPCM